MLPMPRFRQILKRVKAADPGVELHQPRITAVAYRQA
jgi:hypothetical protein